MLEELFSSAVKISLSAEEKYALLRRSDKKKECILDLIRQRIPVPLQIHEENVLMFGKLRDTEVAKKIFEEEFRLAKNMLIERKLTYSRCFTRALTDKGGKLIKNITRESGTSLHIIQSFGAEQTVVLKGPVEMVNKAELMLKELLSSAVKISLSVEEKHTLLSKSGKKKKCILDVIGGRISVPLNFQDRNVLMFGKPRDTEEAKKIFKEELRLVKEALNSR